MDTAQQHLPKRIVQLDGLRGIAVLLIIIFHLVNNQYSASDPESISRWENILIRITYFGWVGVDLFFVLSGFLIGTILLENKNSVNYFKAFYVRRFFRIVPVFYLLLIIFVILKQTSLYTESAYIFQNNIPILYYFGFIQNFAMGFQGNFGPEALTPSWSLAVEEQFYLIIPWVIYFVPFKHLKYVILFCLLLAPLGRFLAENWYQKYTFLTSRIDSPIIGFLMAYLLFDKKIKSKIDQNVNLIKIIATSLLACSILIYLFSDIGVFNHTVIAFIFGLILLILLHTNSGFLFRIFTFPVLVNIGTISYFLYLYHQLVNGLFHLIILNELLPTLNNLSALMVTMLSLLTTTVLAFLSYRYFEKPLVSYSHKFKYN